MYIFIAGKRPLEDYEPLPEEQNNRPYKGAVWCVVAKGVSVNDEELGSAVNDACIAGNASGTCYALSPGKECYEPVSLTWHASYAFSSYWAKFRSEGATCHFNGLAEQTSLDPSKFFFCSSPKGMPINTRVFCFLFFIFYLYWQDLNHKFILTLIHYSIFVTT